MQLLLIFGSQYVSFGQKKKVVQTLDKNEIAQQSIKMLKKTKASLQVYFNAATDNDEKNAWSTIASNLLEGAIFENDINPKGTSLNDSKELPIKEYMDVIQTRFPNGLNYNVDLHKTKILVKNNQEVFLYARKFMQGDWYFDGVSKPLLNDYNWCRIVLKRDLITLKNQDSKLKIAYVDNDIREFNNASNVPDFSSSITHFTLEDLAEKVASEISKSLPKEETEEIIIDKISYEGKNVINKFSEMITGEIKTMLKLAHPNLKVTLPVRSFNKVLHLKGTYSRQGEFLVFSTSLLNSSGKEIITTSSKVLLNNAEDWLKDIVPTQDFITESDKLNNSVVNTPVNNDANSLFQFEVRTNKGAWAQSFKEEEVLSIYVIANKPCKVRVVYKDAKNNLFYMNNSDFQITENYLNTPVKLPEEFKCSAPFGVEALIGFATTGNFKELKIEKKDGLTYLLETIENLKNKSAGVQTVERLIQITTYSK